MSIFRIYSTKSNTIASGIFQNYNSGQNAAAELWYGGSEVFSNRNSISRHLSQFDIDELQRKILSKEIMSGNVLSYTLNMTNAVPRDAALETDFTVNRLTKEIASSFDLIAFPVNKSWDEGSGHDLLKQNYVVKQIGNPRVTGYSNWNYATRISNWDEPGVYVNPTASTTYCEFSGTVDYNGVTFTKPDSLVSGATYEYSILSNTGLTGSNFNVVVSAVTGNNTTIDYTFNPLSGATSPEFYSGATSYSGMSFFKASGSSTVYDFNILSLDSLSSASELVATASSIYYTYNPLSGGTSSASAYTGTVIYSGLSFTKIDATASTVYDFWIKSSTGITSAEILSITSNTVDYTFNPLSGASTTADLSATLLASSGFTSFGISVSGGSTGTTLTGGDVFYLSASTFLPSIYTPFEPSTLDFQNALTGSTGFTAMDIDVSGGSSGTTATSGDTFFLSASTLIPRTIFPFSPTTTDLITGLTSVSAYDGLDINNTDGNSNSISSGDTFTLTANSLCILINLWSEQHFDIGDEDINMDITPMVNNWIEGEDNNGLAIAYRGDYESRSGDTRAVSSYLTDKTNTAYKPYIEVSYDQVIKDDREQVTNNRESRLFLYTFSGNSPVNFYSAGTVEILSQNNEVIYSGAPTQFEKGVYYFDVLMSDANPGETYRDIWRDVTFVPGVDQQDFTQFFRINKNYYQNVSPSINDYVITTYGIDNGSTLRQTENVRVFADIRSNYSQGSPSPYFDIKYSLVMNNQEEVISWTSMNRVVRNECQETYFDLDVSWLLHNQTYEVKFKIEEMGSSKLLNETIRFNVLRPF